MMYNGNYIQFFYEDGIQILGSDGISPYDGRLGILGITCLAEERLTRLKKIKPRAHSYKIYRRGKEIKG